jgi:betaine-aldehyde dehydrogenase
MSKNDVAPGTTTKNWSDALPEHRSLYYGGAWREPEGGYTETFNPATGESLGASAVANDRDVDAAVAAAYEGFQQWRVVPPLERAALLRKVAEVLRRNAADLAMIDAANCGNPVRELQRDAHTAATQMDLFAGLIPEIKGSTIPMNEGLVNMTLREPIGVCARILAYNHPLMFIAGKAAAAIAAGNSVIMKPPPQAPLSAYRLMELIDGILPAGVINVVTGGGECGEALTTHPRVPVVTLIGAVSTGQKIMRASADQLKRVLFELGGKNALVVYPDADIERVIAGAVKGMNFGWAGQSCGSTSRLFIHESIYDRVLEGVVQKVKAEYSPGIPTDPSTTMGTLISANQLEKVLRYIEFGKQDGARLVLGGSRPVDPQLSQGFFVEPTIFADVTNEMRIAQEEIFGPVLSVLKWSSEDQLYDQVNSTEYGLTAAIYTTDLATAHRAAARVEAGYVWINNSSQHFPGAPFGGYKQSGIGREESIDELLSFTQLKNVNISL